MYFSNGYVYGGTPTETLKVTSVRTMADMILILTFNTGETRLFDATVLEGKAFEPLQNPDVFNSATVEFGMVVWNNGEIDCDPEYMYEHSFEYSQVSA